MAQQGIIPVKLSLTDGDFYTLWAPSWKEHGQEWQAFLGGDDNVYFFHSPAELLAFLSSDQEHDLQTHPKWGAFNSRDAARVVPTSKETMDLVGVPGFLAGRPSHENVSGVARSFAVARSLAGVCALTDVESFFNSHSMLMNVQRGSEHYAGEGGMSEWTSVGHAVLNNWDKILDSLDDIVFVPDTDADAVNTAQSDIDAANIAAEKRRAEEAEAAKKAEEEADPYDASVWGEAGIDPIKIAIDGRLLYSLRTYINGQPVFLGRYGEIYTFNNRRSLVRWLVEHSDHDLASVSTWRLQMAAPWRCRSTPITPIPSLALRMILPKAPRLSIRTKCAKPMNYWPTPQTGLLMMPSTPSSSRTQRCRSTSPTCWEQPLVMFRQHPTPTR